MKTPVTRRSFLQTGIVTGAALAAAPFVSRFGSALAGTNDQLVFRPYPHASMPALSWAYASDTLEDPFKSGINVQRDGIVVPVETSARKFSVNAKWFVEDFGHVWLAADNGGRYYAREDFSGGAPLNLNLEFARSRVMRNSGVLDRYRKDGTVFSPEVQHLTALSEELLTDAVRIAADGERCAKRADAALKYALFAGERIELEKARSDIERAKRRSVYFGCETRQFVWARSEEFMKRFIEVMNFATVTHYVWDSWYELFEPTEGHYNWGIKDDIVHWLAEHGLAIEGRPLFWFHPVVTPDWLKNKNYDGVRAYVERHTRDLLTHYGDSVLQWEVMNEYHDCANIHNHTPEQTVEITRLACEMTKSVNPKVTRIINNCCPWAEYVPLESMARMKAARPLRSPRRFLQELAEGGVDYDVLGIQIYFPQRDLSDIVRLLERLAVFGKPIYITEMGASSDPSGVNPSGARGASGTGLYDWHRHWDEDLQADWLEQVYTIYYSKPYIKAINWYDFSDFRPYIVNGGLVREDSSAKLSFDRLKQLLASWGQLPGRKEAK